MANQPTSNEKLLEAGRAVARHGTVAAAARALGLARSTLNDRYNLAKKLGLISNTFGVLESGDTMTIFSESEEIRTVAKVLEKADIRRDHWRMVDSRTTSQDEGDRTVWRIEIDLERVAPQAITDAMENLFSSAGKRAAPFQPIKRPKLNGRRHLLEVSLFDAHFGKLAWSLETESTYNLNTARTVYDNAVEDLLKSVESFPVEKIIFPVGQDFYHVNSASLTTAYGTHQDFDGRLSKVFEIGCEAVIRAVDRCLQVAPVEVIWVPGNHDPETSWYLANILSAWYRNTPDVVVDKSPTLRKYIRYGVTLLGFTHGNEEPHASLPLLMATERPQLWSATKHREWHLGHFHKKKATEYPLGDTFNGVKVVVLPSLSGTDAWHYKKGYVKPHRSAEAYLWDYKEGYRGHFSANAREG